MVRKGEPSTHSAAPSGRQAQLIMRCNLCAATIRSDRLGVAIDDIIVDAVLEVEAGRADAAQTAYIRLVLTKQQLRTASAVKPQRRQPRVIDRDRVILARDELRPHRI